MNRLLIACLLLAVVTGCSKTNDPRVLEERMPQKLMAPMAAPATVAAPDSPRRTLAYSHSIEISTPEDKVTALHQAALAACQGDTADLCEVLESRVNTGHSANAFLRLRAKPAGIPKLIASLGQQGEITSQSTEAEDLGGPIQDGEKKIAMLTSYRTELEALRKRPGNDVDALIKVAHELAQVQSQLESVTGTQATLIRRVETETLSISIQSTRTTSSWSPITSAVSDFGGNLSQGVSSVLTGVAYLLPWSLLLALVIWIIRKLWRRRKAH